MASIDSCLCITKNFKKMKTKSFLQVALTATILMPLFGACSSDDNGNPDPDPTPIHGEPMEVLRPATICFSQPMVLKMQTAL